MLKRLLVLFLITLLSASSVSAREKAFLDFFDDLFGGDDAPTVDPYSFDAVLVSSEGATISKTAKILRIKIFYPKSDLTAVNALSNAALNSAVSEVLTVTSIDADGARVVLADLDFELRYKQAKSKYTDFYEIQLTADNVILDKPQRLEFSFNSKRFIRVLNLEEDLEEDSYTDKIFVKPIVINLKGASLQESLTSAINGAVFANQNITVNFSYNTEDLLTAVDNGDLAFQYKNNGVTKTALAKSSTKSYPLTISQIENGGYLTESSNIYSLDLPISLGPTTSNAAFSTGTSFTIVIPLQIETQTSSGLSVLLRGIAKGKLSVL